LFDEQMTIDLNAHLAAYLIATNAMWVVGGNKNCSTERSFSILRMEKMESISFDQFTYLVNNPIQAG
jgi:hypothetical protein